MPHLRRTSAADINVDTIVQNEPVAGDRSAEISFTVPKDDANSDPWRDGKVAGELGPAKWKTNDQMGKVSIGAGHAQPSRRRGEGV